MICYKCGTQAVEGAAFCQKCGEKLVQEDAGFQRMNSGEALSDKGNDIKVDVNNRIHPKQCSTIPAHQLNAASTDTTKKSRMLPIVICSAVMIGLVVILVRLFAPSNNSGNAADVYVNRPAGESSNSASRETQLLEDWISGHLADEEVGISLVNENGRYFDGSDAYEFLMMFDREEQYSIYVVKDTGEMFIAIEGEAMLLDDWYDIFWGDGIWIEEDEYPYMELDPMLCGRWRADDGGALVLDEYGSVTNVFKFWNALNREPDSVTWSAFDGYLTLGANYSIEYQYAIREGTQYVNGEEVATDELILRKDYISEYIDYGEYYRIKTDDIGLVGIWKPRALSGDFIFYGDGTGVIGNNWLTWWADETTLYYNVSEQKTYDYIVSGDVLTIFFSDGTRSYTKVGN